MQLFIKRTVQLSFILAFVVILLGAYTRLKDAGLGCPDWPGCYGQLTVPNGSAAIERAQQLYPDAPLEAGKAHVEMIHRYFASTLGLLILLLLGARLLSPQSKLPIWLPVTLLVWVIFQGALGMWTVTLKLLPIVVMGHLLGGFITLSLLCLAWYQLHHNPLKLSYAPPIGLSLATLVVVFLQICLGGWTSANYAAIICPDFPTCQGHILPPAIWDALNLTSGWNQMVPSSFMHNDARVSVQLLHRFGALLATIMVVILHIALIKFCKSQTDLPSKLKLTLTNRLMVTLLLVQLGLGVSNVIFQAPLPIAVMHNGIGALMLITLACINYQLMSKETVRGS